MFRIVRTTALADLMNDREHLAGARAALGTTQASLTDSRRAAELLEEKVEQLQEDVIETRQSAASEFDGLQAVIRQVTAERDAARAERDDHLSAVAEVRADIQRLKDAAADTTDTSVRGAIAYRVLADLYADAYAKGMQPNRPFEALFSRSYGEVTSSFL
ncbi:hypothetical protein [Streptomyces cinereoruber]|uniref:hypothetical protein n=1 Tax=Streptomyces cinereoruber TaxID=67260 RepID=UPI00363FD3C1